MKTIRLLSVFLLSVFLMTGCVITSRIRVEEDVVYGSKRVKWDYVYLDRDRYSPLMTVTQSIVKEINEGKEATLRVYDVLSLNARSHKPEQKVFLIIDGKVFPMTLRTAEFNNFSSFSEDTNDILTSDSTKVTVVTGYTEDRQLIAKFSYDLSAEVIQSAETSNSVSFRYYAGPSMMTVSLNGKSLNRFKKFLRMQ